MKDIFRLSGQPRLENPSMIVGWQEDAGQVSPQVLAYIRHKIAGQVFCQIEPEGFFPLAGVAVAHDVVQFPEDKFYCGQRSDLVIFEGSEPQFDRYRFLNCLLDVAEHHCKIRELFTLEAIVCPIAHSSPRKILAVSNQLEMQKKLSDYSLSPITYEGPSTIGSYLLSLAKGRGIPGVGLWLQVPFYLGAALDPKAVRQALSFLNERFSLDLNIGPLDRQVEEQNQMMSRLREEDPKIDKYIGVVEDHGSLSADQQLQLTKKVSDFLKGQSQPTGGQQRQLS